MHERSIVRRSFSRHARDYDALAFVQREVVERFDRMIGSIDVDARHILEIGSGTGRLSELLRKRFPRAVLRCVDIAHGMHLVARSHGRGGDLVTADAEALPFPDGIFDLVVSTSTFQWLDTLDHAFAEAWRVLGRDGTLLFAFFGGRTLYELKRSYQSAVVEHGGEDVTHRFFSAEETDEALSRAGFMTRELVVETFCEYYPDALSMVRMLKQIGAGTVRQRTSQGLPGGGALKRMLELYEDRFGSAAGVPATYEVYFVQAKS